MLVLSTCLVILSLSVDVLSLLVILTLGWQRESLFGFIVNVSLLQGQPSWFSWSGWLLSLSLSEVLWETLDQVDLGQCNGPARYTPVRFSFASSSKPTGSIHTSLKKLPRLWEIKECVVFAFFICRTGTDTFHRYPPICLFLPLFSNFVLTLERLYGSAAV